MNKLIEELKRRFGTPENVLRRLGLDSQLLKEDEMDGRGTRSRAPARVGHDEDEPMRTAGELIDAISAALHDLPVDEHEELLDFFRELADSGDLEQWAAGTVGDRTRQARDNPPPFPGRPNPGGEMDPMEARDRRRRQAEDRAALAFDRAHGGTVEGLPPGIRPLHERNPGVARIRSV
jgi:hypothetical protein